MRTKNSIINITATYANFSVGTTAKLIYRYYFITILGVEYLGLNALYTNLIFLLSAGEMGVAQAISFSLYKPLSKGDDNKIVEIVAYLRKVYFIIGLGVLFLGFCLLPVLPFISNEVDHLSGAYTIFLLFVVNASSTYFFTHKRIFITACQKGYKIAPYLILFQLIDLSLKILLLYVFESFELILISQLVIKCVECYMVNRFISDEYPIVNTELGTLTSLKTKRQIKSNIVSLIFHKTGDVILNGTDNIIVSKYLSFAMLGLFSNYILVMQTLVSLLSQTFSAVISSVGNLIATKEQSHVLQVLKALELAGFVIFSFCSIYLYLYTDYFISLWLGREYVVETNLALLQAISLYLFGMRIPINTVKSAAGLYVQDKYAPIIQSVINLVISVYLVQDYGVDGVIIGTIVSGILVPLWVRPMIVYRNLLTDKSLINYYLSMVGYTVVFLLTLLFSSYVFFEINYIDNKLIKGVVLSPIIVFMLVTPNIFRKEFKFIYRRIAKRYL
ncbi:oligosaccharide flippase family protein [Vibrio sp. 1CM2L]|uniref:lipopolysaccharide biosynthesis protein n=1 Tax=Vibrio sp. 1CM2L TaxID=2929166 RepID=UPI0020BE2419|nr:oligosaccharide flippase family protein [Vibrio sp. 1CM2L]MCK8078708.1 oligosaccharide flippase family protein [Vibrio sp. 1CM2L]